ncbi:hypothetical protein MB901379_02134 [Mycobacterium basiliense]|uniref:Uncharacterized protein n=1 Tax=Mycobacterium basiliense TaxID=2094119 RepID=A0A3S4DT16_9MYCO|nr:hypothetical protein MB901379_02134 [Mycobacterium basiliense]
MARRRILQAGVSSRAEHEGRGVNFFANQGKLRYPVLETTKITAGTPHLGTTAPAL